jgi:outer membrane protein
VIDVYGFAPTRRRMVCVACLGVTAMLASCVHNPPDVDGKPSAPAAPNQFWDPPMKAVIPDSVPTLALPPDIAERVRHLTLANVIDIGLSTNPLTRQSYAEARAAGAAIGSAVGKYLPQLNVGVTGERESSKSGVESTGGSTSTGTGSTSTGSTTGSTGSVVRGTGTSSLLIPDASASWLLFDFSRSSSIEYAKQGAFAASFTHNATVQSVVLTLEQAYFNYNASKAVVSGDSLSVKEDSVNLASATAQHNAGIATLSDVLQAQTTLSEEVLQLETDQGSVQTTRGSLAVAMGFPANLTYDIQADPPDVPIQGIAASVDSLVSQAVRTRPDLASYRAQFAEAQANVGVVRGAGLPSLSLGASDDYAFANPSSLNGNTYVVSAGISFPLFQGFQNAYNLLQAKELAKAQGANAEYQRDLVINQVFTSYYNLRTATARVRSTNDLLVSAQSNYNVATGQYKQGVGNILEVVTAQAALATARSQQAQARWTWYYELAQLSHDVGVIGIHGEMRIPLRADSTGTSPR